MKTVSNIVTTSNCLHIALLVYLRVVAISKPLQYESIHRKHHIKTPLLIWCIAIIINILGPTSRLFDSKDLNFFASLFILHGFHTFPILSIIILYTRMINVIHKRNQEHMKASKICDENDGSISSSKLSTKMIKGVSICLVVCYVPYLLWFQYVRIKHCIYNENDLSMFSKWEVSKNTSLTTFHIIKVSTKLQLAFEINYN